MLRSGFRAIITLGEEPWTTHELSHVLGKLHAVTAQPDLRRCLRYRQAQQDDYRSASLTR